jgi:hypothetical protein
VLTPAVAATVAYRAAPCLSHFRIGAAATGVECYASVSVSGGGPACP